METGIHELTAGYALDALDGDERRAYEAHLSGCERCRKELASFWETTAALAVAASGPEPSPELRNRILADVHAEPPQVVVPFEARRGQQTVPVLAAAAAIAAVVAVAVGLWASSLSNDLDEARAALERARAAAVVVADPSARSVSLQEGSGRLVVAPGGSAALVLAGLGPAPDGKTYQIWIVEGGMPASAGLFAGREGGEVVGVEGVVGDGDVVAVTIEDAGGVDAPTSPPVASSEPV